MTDAYREDLTFIHDVGFGHLAKNAAPVLLEALRQIGTDHGLVVNLGCGIGLLAKELSADSYQVLGIAISGTMPGIARKRVPSACFRQDSILEAHLLPCASVLAVGECFNHLFDEDNNEQGLCELFGRIHRVLDAGGIFLFDEAEPGRVSGSGPQLAHNVLLDLLGG
jgi:SAM-dependent methyltransferase